ncbi:hypothetical protein C1O40_11120 [Akkermansia muciniphila]|uniref:hypothetical protein n=1 Tax=Akkermansia muciniphila TaxID=239935 RepID=UPI000FE16524|nr:hypothetical protein [Akkermansia muciniphila]QAA49024.1 hypothetical protein C1O40_11120 [Akkermansia muciniphila]
MGKIKDWQESTTRPREHKHKTRFILAIQDGVPYVNKASPHDDSSPLGITLALSLTCGSMPLLAQGTYMPGPMPATSGTKQDPTDMYLEALRLVTQAAGLVEKRDYIGAIRLTQQAEDKFGRLAKSYPNGVPTCCKRAASSTGKIWTSGRSWPSSRPPPLLHPAQAWRWNARPPCRSAPGQNPT